MGSSTDVRQVTLAARRARDRQQPPLESIEKGGEGSCGQHLHLLRRAERRSQDCRSRGQPTAEDDAAVAAVAAAAADDGDAAAAAAAVRGTPWRREERRWERREQRPEAWIDRCWARRFRCAMLWAARSSADERQQEQQQEQQQQEQQQQEQPQWARQTEPQSQSQWQTRLRCETAR